MKNGIKEKDIRDFKKYAEKLLNVLNRIREYKPEANAYFDDDILNLLSGESHDENARPNYQNVVTSINMPNFGGGGW